MNVSGFIRNHRMKVACRLALEHPDLRVSDIAYQVGFKDPKYFATTFKKELGMQPSEYFEQLRSGSYPPPMSQSESDEGESSIEHQ